MPTLKRLSNCTIHMYAADHLPPHFHVRMADGEVLVVIATMKVLRGDIPARKLEEAIAWANAHVDFLIAKWKELNP